jgi:tricorn protease
VNLDRKLDGLRTYELADYFKEAADKVRKKFGASPAAAGGGSASGAAGGGARPGGARRGGGGGAPAAAAAPAPEEKPADQPKEEEKKEETKPAAKSDEPSPEKPLTFDSDDAFLRVRKLSGLPENIGTMTATPGGERVIFTASVDGTSSLLSVDYSGKDRKTVFAGPGSDLSVSLGGDRVLFTSGGAAPRGDTPAEGPPRQAGGQPYLGRPGGGEAEAMPIDAPLVIDIEAQQKQKFRDAARLMGQRFYHPTLKGLDWPALMSRYESIIIRTRTDTEFNRIFNNLLGELEGSHMGMSGGRSTQGDGQSLGYLGADLKRVAGGYQVTRIVPNGPADRKATKLNVGDVIVAINSKPLANGVDAQPRVDFASAMQGTSGQETLLEIRNGGGKTRNLLITPIAAGADTNLRYQDEVRQRKEMVDKLSDGKLGYLHIRAMDFGSVRDYERDLFAAADGKLGLIIDVRDNGGGSTTDVLLSSLTAPRHAYTASRGVDLKELPKDAYPRDRRLIYAYNREISVLLQPALVLERGDLLALDQDDRTRQGGRHADVRRRDLHGRIRPDRRLEHADPLPRLVSAGRNGHGKPRVYARRFRAADA